MAILVTKKWSTPKLNVTPQGATLNETYNVSGVSDVKAALDAMYAAYPETRYNYPSPLSPYLLTTTQNSKLAGFNLYEIEVTWSSTSSGATDPQNPLNEPAKYRLDWQNVTEAAGRDTFGNAVENSANQSFDTDSPAEIITGLLTVERNEPFYDAPKAVAYSNAVNNANITFHGIWPFEKGQVCCRKISCLTPINGQEKYVTIQYQLELRGGYEKDAGGYWDGFKIRVLDQGSRGYYSDAGTIKPGPIVEVVDGQVRNVSQAVRLNGFGKPISSATSLTAFDGYYIGTGKKYAVPVNSPTRLPATTIIYTTPDANFVKFFPEGIKLKDLSALGL